MWGRVEGLEGQGDGGRGEDEEGDRVNRGGWKRDGGRGEGHNGGSRWVWGSRGLGTRLSMRIGVEGLLKANKPPKPKYLLEGRREGVEEIMGG